MKIKQTILLAALASLALPAAPIRSFSGLSSVVAYEVTTVVNQFAFAPNSAAITSRVSGNLGLNNADFAGAPTEYYDIFYSDANGAPDIDGSFITIEGVYGAGGSGMNIGEVQLIFNNGNPSQFANSLASYVQGATDFLPANLNNILDGNTATSTGMGQNGPNQRMRLTVGFADPPTPTTGVPEPSSFLLGAAGVAGILALRHHR